MIGRRARIEAARQITPEVLDALHGARLFRALLPRAIGGDRRTRDLLPDDGGDRPRRCLHRLVHRPGVRLLMAAAYVAPEVAQDLGTDRRVALAWGARGRTSAEVVDGGYRVTGSWPFASGGRHATWLGGHCRVRERDGTHARATADGAHRTHHAVPAQGQSPWTETGR